MTNSKHFIITLTLMVSLFACQSKQDFQSVDTQTFATIIADSNVVLLDVRTQAEYQQAHIPHALLIDAMQPTFVEQAKQQLAKDRTIALYCRSGRRSKAAASQLAAEGYSVVELNAGFNAWQAAGFEVEK